MMLLRDSAALLLPWMRSIGLLVVLATCNATNGPAAVEPSSASLQVDERGGFHFVIEANMLHPLNSEQAEHARLVRLGDALRARHLCPAGFAIDRRDPPRAYGRFNIRVTERVVTPIVYTGHCVPPALVPK